MSRNVPVSLLLYFGTHNMKKSNILLKSKLNVKNSSKRRQGRMWALRQRYEAS